MWGKHVDDVLEATGHLGEGRHYAARRAFALLLERYPDDPATPVFQKQVRELDASMRAAGISEDDARVMGDVETANWLAVSGRLDEACRLARQSVARRPHPRAMNTLALLQWEQGEVADAVAILRDLGARHPADVFGRCNLATYLTLLGQSAEAEEVRRSLGVDVCGQPDEWVKVAETLTLAGDDGRVLEFVDVALERTDGSSLRRDLLRHFAAVASARLGQHDRARESWKQALDLNPALHIAAANLDDYDRPACERLGAYSHGAEQWLPRPVRVRLNEIAACGSEEGAERKVRRFLGDFPYVVDMAPGFLDRGWPGSVDLIVVLATWGGDARLAPLLVRTARGQRGSDDTRVRAAVVATRMGLVAAGELRMWLDGRWRETVVPGCAVTFGDPSLVPLPARALQKRGLECLRQDRPEAAEECFLLALEQVPGHPTLLLDQAVARERLGQSDRVAELLRAAHEADPTHVAAAVCLAALATPQEARRLLLPLCELTEMHVTDFSRLCAAWVQLSKRVGDLDEARAWLAHWADVDPSSTEPPR